MSEPQEISVGFLSTMDSMTPIYPNSVDGRQFDARCMEIAARVEEFPLMLELINAKRATLKAIVSD